MLVICLLALSKVTSRSICCRVIDSTVMHGVHDLPSALIVRCPDPIYASLLTEEVHEWSENLDPCIRKQ